jgi:neutral ceramidase
MFDATQIIGQHQAEFAMRLSDEATVQLTGGIAYSHTFIDAQNITVSGAFTSTGVTEKTCRAALGDSFAAGTTDGAGDFNFVQGTNDTHTNRFWNKIAYLILSEPTQDEIDCQSPKPILLNLGDMNFPAPWAASIVPIQIFKIGQFFLVGVPGEFTTMSGRRLRNTVRTSLQKHGLADENSYIVISGLSNEYTHYITTYQEYRMKFFLFQCENLKNFMVINIFKFFFFLEVQRYEAASTLYGPHTLAAYQQEFDRLITFGLALNRTSLPGPTPPNLNYVHVS